MSTKFTILLPVYNGIRYIERALNSVLNQNYNNFELIIVNDGSFDGTQIICEKFEELYSFINLYNKENEGIASARNFALKKAFERNSDTKIMWLDADDELKPGLLNHLNNLFLSHPNCKLIFYDYELINDGGTTYNSFINSRYQKFGLQQGDDLLSQLLIGDINNYLWAFAADLHLYTDIIFPLGKKYEDVASVYKILLKLDYGYISDFNGYKYYVDNQMSLTKNFSLGDAFDLFQIVKDMELFRNELPFGLVEVFQSIYLINIMINLATCKDPISIELLDEIEVYFKKIKRYLKYQNYKNSRYFFKILVMKFSMLRFVYKIKGIIVK